MDLDGNETLFIHESNTATSFTQEANNNSLADVQSLVGSIGYQRYRECAYNYVGTIIFKVRSTLHTISIL